MSIELGMCIADVNSAVGFIKSHLDDDDYYMVRKAWARIDSARRALAAALDWGSLEYDCPWCSNKPNGCQHCHGTGRVNQALIDNRDERL